jgi:hypothetical protein
VKCLLLLFTFNRNWNVSINFSKIPNNKFHEYPLICSWIVTCAHVAHSFNLFLCAPKKWVIGEMSLSISFLRNSQRFKWEMEWDVAYISWDNIFILAKYRVICLQVVKESTSWTLCFITLSLCVELLSAEVIFSSYFCV